MAVDLSTPEKAAAHLAAIIEELELERTKKRKRNSDMEWRLRRLEMAVLLLYGELLQAQEPPVIEVKKPEPKAPPPPPLPREPIVSEPDWDQSGGMGGVDGSPQTPAPSRPKTRNFVQELLDMAK